jgi:hypothetical protein
MGSGKRKVHEFDPKANNLLHYEYRDPMENPLNDMIAGATLRKL